MIEVVSGIIVRDGRVFLVQRSEKRKQYPLGWECPGGKVEPGEAGRAALARELHEELGIESCIVESAPVFSATVENDPECGGESFRVTMYRVGLPHGVEPWLREEQAGCGWFLPEETRALRLLPGNSAGREHIERTARESA